MQEHELWAFQKPRDTTEKFSIVFHRLINVNGSYKFAPEIRLSSLDIAYYSFGALLESKLEKNINGYSTDDLKRYINKDYGHGFGKNYYDYNIVAWVGSSPYLKLAAAFYDNRGDIRWIANPDIKYMAKRM